MKFVIKLLRRLFKRKHRCTWNEVMKVSADKQTYYFVRTCHVCGAEQIQDRWGAWNDVTTAKFSANPMWDADERKRFETSSVTASV